MPQLSPTDWSLHYPKAGMSREFAFGRQPNRDVGESVWARTTPLGVNVRGYEQAGRRLRGGTRMGFSKYLDSRPGDVRWVTQHLNTIVHLGGGGVQLSNQGRVVNLIAVSRGNVYVTEPEGTSWTAATNSSSTTPPLNFSGVMQSTACVQKLWFVDGVHYRQYDPLTNVVSDWVPTAGSLPVDSDNNRATLCCTWNGRVVLSGLAKDPQNWFMSRVVDPLDFLYRSSVNDTAQAVAGNNGPLGLVGDVVNTLIPYSDDILVFGCDSSIFKMQGDPYHGGQIDLVTKRIGMAYGKPWAQGPSGVIYFFSNTGGVYAMNPRGSEEPVRISQPIEQLVQGVNTGTHQVLMEWDDTFQELKVWVTRLAGTGVTDHYVWEARNKAWWVDRYGNVDHNPLATCVVDGNRPGDRCIVAGGWDGYVRKLDPEATDDDGTPIEFEVLVGPLRTPNLDDVVVDQAQFVAGEGSADAELSFLVGKTAERALASPSIAAGTIRAGRNATKAKRVAGHAVYARVTGEAPWAMEELRVRVQPKGLARRRVK